MRGSRLVIVLVLFGLVAFWGYRKFFPSDEKVIRNLLAEAAEAGSIRPTDSGMTKFASVKRLMNMCMEDVRVVVDAPGARSLSVEGRERLGEALAGVRATTESLSIELIDIGIEVEEDRSEATAQFIARVEMERSRDEIVQEFRILLKRVDGEWKFARIEPLASLSM